MVLLIAGASHTGKTALAQKILEKYNYNYLSVDLLKMGLIRSRNTELTPEDDEELVPYLWPIVSEIIKTAVENGQNIVIEGCYIPFDWRDTFSEDYRKEIQYLCLVMSENYINGHFQDIKKYSDVIEKRIDNTYITKELLLKDNLYNLRMCKKYGLKYILIDGQYPDDIGI